MPDIFDTENIDDIPQEIAKDLVSNDFEKNIITLFDIAKRELSINELTVGYFRKFNVVKTKREINTKVYSLTKKRNPKIKSVSKGVYKLIKE